MAMGIQAELSPLQRFGMQAIGVLNDWKSGQKPEMEVTDEIRGKWRETVEQSAAFKEVQDGLLLMAQLTVLAGDYGLNDEVIPEKMATLGAIVARVQVLEQEKILDIDIKREWLNVVESMLVTMPSDESPNAPRGITY